MKRWNRTSEDIRTFRTRAEKCRYNSEPFCDGLDTLFDRPLPGQELPHRTDLYPDENLPTGPTSTQARTSPQDRS